MVSDVSFGGDIVLAEKILSGQIAKVIFFHDPSATFPDANLSLLLRACDLASVPIALNEASANIGLMAQKATRKAYLIFNPIAGQRDSALDLEIIRETLEPRLVLTVVETEKDLDPALQAKKLVEIIQKEGPSEDGTYSMIIASGGDGTVSAIAGATMGSGMFRTLFCFAFMFTARRPLFTFASKYGSLFDIRSTINDRRSIWCHSSRHR